MSYFGLGQAKQYEVCVQLYTRSLLLLFWRDHVIDLIPCGSRVPDRSACEQAGLQMWMYTSLEPWGNFTNILFHNPLYEPRLLFWQVFQLRLTGYLYYDLCSWGSSWDAKNNHTQSHKLIDGNSLSSPFIDPHDWNPMQTTGVRTLR